MRVCLDTALQAPWQHRIKAPAIRHLSLEQLENAVSVAESLVVEPERLLTLNEWSIQARRRRLPDRQNDGEPLPIYDDDRR